MDTDDDMDIISIIINFVIIAIQIPLRLWHYTSHVLTYLLN